MRIIGGIKGGYRIQAPKNLPTRPTTDRSKESLFNMLENWYDFDDCHVLDLYGGTGNVTYEFASRGALSVVCIDRFKGCTDFIKSECLKLEFQQVTVINGDVLAYLESCTAQFDIIFADPPFATKDYEKIHSLIHERNLLTKRGTFVMEHHSVHDFSKLTNFVEQRNYGQNVMSFYSKES